MTYSDVRPKLCWGAGQPFIITTPLPPSTIHKQADRWAGRYTHHLYTHTHSATCTVIHTQIRIHKGQSMFRSYIRWLNRMRLKTCTYRVHNFLPICTKTLLTQVLDSTVFTSNLSIHYSCWLLLDIFLIHLVSSNINQTYDIPKTKVQI